MLLLGGRLMCTQQMCTTRRPFQRLGGLLSNHPNQNQKKNNKLSNEKVHCRKVSATFSRSSEMRQFPRKVQKIQFFSRTVFANEKTHLGPTVNTCKVGAWRAALKNYHSLLFSAQRLVHVCWLHVRCPSELLWSLLFGFCCCCLVIVVVFPVVWLLLLLLLLCCIVVRKPFCNSNIYS